MTLRKPLVLNNGRMEQIQSGDVLDAAIIETEAITLTNDESSDAITEGMPVYINAANGCKKARANAVGTTDVIALCKTASVTASQPGTFVTSGQLDIANWTAVIGSSTLTSGTKYYLSTSTGGMLVSTAPTVASNFVEEVGEAISTTTMQVNIKNAIKL